MHLHKSKLLGDDVGAGALRRQQPLRELQIGPRGVVRGGERSESEGNGVVVENDGENGDHVRLELLKSPRVRADSSVVAATPRTRKRILWFVRINDTVAVFARKPRRGKLGKIVAGKRIHSMCYRGFFATFGLALRKNEAIRMPIMSLCERHVLKPRKRHTVLPPWGDGIWKGMRDAYEELIGQFMQGPPVAPAKNSWADGDTITGTDGTTWTINAATSFSDTNDVTANITWAELPITNSTNNTFTMNYVTT